tara:strand:+ start:740 stop:1678 length:939 start_codon:yes stop_codon:yes gene_type:complete
MLLNNKIRIAGAQIPVSTDIQFNKQEIFKALDWAKENNVDHLLTPEGSLSGYGPKWTFDKQELFDALRDVETKQKQSGVSLHLGTCHQEHEEVGDVYRNEIRHYDQYGDLYSVTNKICLVGIDLNCLPGKEINTFKLPYRSDREYLVAGMICNDMWQWEANQCLNTKMATISPDLILHSTNGVKFNSHMVKKVEDIDIDYDRFHLRNIFEDYHMGYLQLTAMMCSSTILTVDSCVPWNWDPDENTVDDFKTSSQSGILSPLGWLVKANNYGRQYFHYDLDLYHKDKAWRIITEHSDTNMENVQDSSKWKFRN